MLSLLKPPVRLDMAFKATWTLGMLRTLLPSFVADVVWPEHRPAYKIHPTSYLDGLRGLASFVVFFCHYTELNHGYFTPSYGLNGDHVASCFIQLPYARVIFSGRPMVHIFFIISGFVLSYKPLKSIHALSLDKCYTVLSSSVFRRPIRLFLPCVVSTFLVAFLIQYGYHAGEKKESLAAQLWNWKSAVFRRIAWPWEWDRHLFPPYDIHLWTIPIEFNHSMLLFLGILGLARLRLRLRQALTVAIMLYALCSGKWAAFEFYAGMFLAEVHILQSHSRPLAFLDDYYAPLAETILRPAVRNTFHAAVLLAAFFVAGWPNQGAELTSGIAFLNARTPSSFRTDDVEMPQKFWFAISALFIVWSCGEVPAIRRFLEGALAQYCGRISYAIYIMHGPGLEMWQGHVLGRPYVSAKGAPGDDGFEPAMAGQGVRGILGIATPTQKFMTWLVGLLILGPAIVWMSDLFWRLVDAPIVTLGRKMENACLDNTPSSEYKQQDGYSLAS